ncbi:MAG: sensor histidine kinase [Myxococcota bacterium]
MVNSHQRLPARDLTGVLYVGLGLALGCAYVAFDLMAEARLESGTLTGALARTHALVDHSLPVLCGALLGLCLYQLRLRKRLHAAEEAASRAEALRQRLSRVERDQAVWILAASVLHELNNPLHALGLLLDEHANCDDEEQRGQLSARARSQMNRILSPLAALRALRGGAEPEIREVPLPELLRAVADELSVIAAPQRIELDVACEALLRVHADANYVRTILENLVANSLQALDGARCGNISIRAYAANADRAVIQVADDGPELPREMRTTLFDPLRSTKTHGLGLGLPIARALARAMHGELTLDDVAAKSFRLELPREASA